MVGGTVEQYTLTDHCNICIYIYTCNIWFWHVSIERSCLHVMWVRVSNVLSSPWEFLVHFPIVSFKNSPGAYCITWDDVDIEQPHPTWWALLVSRQVFGKLWITMLILVLFQNRGPLEPIVILTTVPIKSAISRRIWTLPSKIVSWTHPTSVDCFLQYHLWKLLNKGLVAMRSCFFCRLPSLKLTLPLKIGHPKRKVVFQPSIFRCYVSFREGN